MSNSPRRRSSGFTLIELLTVIAIIGILAAIFIPTMGSARDKAQRAVDSSNLREIVKAATIYASDNSDRLPDPQPTVTPNTVLNAAQLVFKWPGILAKNNILSDPTFYFSKSDAAFSGTYPTFIIQPSAARNTLNATFTTGTALAWEFVGGVKMSDSPNSPVAYTRGLTAAGTWSPTSGVYKDSGGFVAFLGGNITFYPNTNNPSPFYSNNPTSTSTTKPIDVRQAIPFNATNTNLSSRIYATPPVTGAGGMLGAANGTLAARGP